MENTGVKWFIEVKRTFFFKVKYLKNIFKYVSVHRYAYIKLHPKKWILSTVMLQNQSLDAHIENTVLELIV